MFTSVPLITFLNCTHPHCLLRLAKTNSNDSTKGLLVPLSLTFLGFKHPNNSSCGQQRWNMVARSSGLSLERPSERLMRSGQDWRVFASSAAELKTF
ncbi:hypothetical protein RSOLAG1IB_09226 [Rhizoctonia solani AG-1 IB]|uniref:Uncharacterized protein n=1 Tax=Thanatephorus cucumeris (strain AG1-IB / isolate 7/3/14) TaxID=1108050 RepID=A0A0B7FUT4_THACB|nr:hypothetical protein RSOLAG1IB_09226 [Rhizoctonia solani AG-1 IB]